MENREAIWKYAAIGAVVIALAIFAFMKLNEQPNPEPTETGYYTGPMRAKGGNTWGTEDGKEVAPPGGQTAEQSVPRIPNPDDL